MYGKKIIPGPFMKNKRKQCTNIANEISRAVENVILLIFKLHFINFERASDLSALSILRSETCL